MHKRCELNIDFEVALVGFPWLGAHHFKRALSHNLGLAHSQQNLTVFLAELDLIDLPRCIFSVVLKLCLSDQARLLSVSSICTAIQLDSFKKELALIFGQILEHLI